jgi:hypothetical protein
MVRFQTIVEKTMKRLIILFLIISFSIIPFAVQAQEALIIEELEVELWPEYDQPSMLVIFRVTLNSQVSLPADVQLRIPARVGDPLAVAIQDLDGSLLNAPFERTVEGDWAIISVTASLPEIHLEYYDANLEIDGGRRQFDFSWISDYPVQSFSVDVQQPVGATELETTPAATQVNLASDGLTYHTIEMGGLLVNAPVTVAVSYEKQTDDLSFEGLQVQPSAPITTTTAGRGDITAYLPWLVGGLGVVLLVGGGVWYWRAGQAEPQPRKRSRGQRVQSARQSAASDPKNDIYCHQCGKRAGGTDRFCRSCGTKLRIR